MTARLIWEGMLTELSKVNAPSLLLLDFNYFINKAINQYINKRYNIYDVNQQTTDDLRVLKATATLFPTKTTIGKSQHLGKYTGTYEVTFPYDYLHLLNCICVYKLNSNFKCYDEGNYVEFPAKRLTADSWSMIINDYYNRPLPWRPYYYIHNVNRSVEEPTNSYSPKDKTGTDQSLDLEENSTIFNKEDINTDKIKAIELPQVKLMLIKEPNFPGYIITLELFSLLLEADIDPYITGYLGECFLLRRFDNSNRVPYFRIINKKDFNEYESFYIDSSGIKYIQTEEEDLSQISGALDISKTYNTKEFPRNMKNLQMLQLTNLVDKPAYTRHSNLSEVRCEIRYGKDNSVFELVEVMIDYIKSPLYIRLTQEQVDMTIDTSLVMEFPDYVCLEIINELTILVMENTSNPRLLTNAIVTQSIALPAQQLTPKITKSAKAD